MLKLEKLLLEGTNNRDPIETLDNARAVLSALYVLGLIDTDSTFNEIDDVIHAEANKLADKARR